MASRWEQYTGEQETLDHRTRLAVVRVFVQAGVERVGSIRDDVRQRVVVLTRREGVAGR